MRPLLFLCIVSILTCLIDTAASGTPAHWDMQRLSTPPHFYEDAQRSDGDVKAIFYDGLLWKGKPTRVFAYYGFPKNIGQKKVPAMVLVHGGGGSAFIPWVRLWTSRGYAAIAMDTCGCISGGGYENHPRHAFGGPAGWGGFDQLDLPVEDQWTYQAVADVILAHSLIRSFPEVNSQKIGLTGISWGGYLSCIVSGVDTRFQFVAPVYGCGFLGENSTWLNVFKSMGQEKAALWLGQWDPSIYLTNTHMPVLWIAGTTDFAYPLDSWTKSTRLSKGPVIRSLRINMPHGHGGPGENPIEILAEANSIFSNGVPLAKIIKNEVQGNTVSVTFKSHVPIAKAHLNYTLDNGEWNKRKWLSTEAALDFKHGKAQANIPTGATVFYIQLVDERGYLVSSEPVIQNQSR